MLNTDGYNPNELKSQRPDLRKAHFQCVKCKCEPRGWASTGYHVGTDSGLPDGSRGVIHGALLCHGDQIEVMIPFGVAAGYIARGELIPVFDNVNPWPAERLLTPGGPLG